MNQLVKKLFARIIRSAPAALALAALWAATVPLNAEAASFSAGNTVIRNTINVNYKDANGIAQAQVSASIDITVNTVAAAPTIVSPIATSPGTTDGLGATTTQTFRIRTNSNGPGVVSFTTGETIVTNITSLGATPGAPASIFLGSTIIDPSDVTKIGTSPTVNAGANITFIVPNDGGIPTDTAVTGGAPGDGKINGLMAGKTVYIYAGGATYYGPFTVGTVTDPSPVGGTTAAPGSIQLLNNIAGTGNVTLSNIAYGWQIVEYKDISLTVTQGAVTDPTAAASWVTTLTATMGGLSTSTPTATTNAKMGKIDIKKYVRNVTTPVVGGGLTATSPLTGAANFYTTGVNGKPGEILEYLAVLTDTGIGNSTAVYATDVTPTYVTLVTFPVTYGTTPGSAMTGIFAQASYLGTTANLKANNTGGTANVAYGQSTGTTAGSTMSFNLGNLCSSVYPTGGGTLTNNQIAYVIYQVKID